MSGAVYPLFAIPVFYVPIQNYEVIDSIVTNDVIKRNVVKEPEGWKCNVNTSYLNRNDDSWFNEFYNVIETEIKQSFKKFFNADILCEMDKPWINEYEKGYFQEKHQHLNLEGYNYSYCYFHRLPDHKDCAKFVFNSNNYNIEYMTKTPFLTQEVCIPEVKQYDLIVFPSWVQHSVTKHNIDMQRVTISGNFKVSKI